ncbi:hypothetical protein [Agromyces sp. NPDC058126]|uniref:hypothetical protein n=1 Tax=Agromyces sp. NPDC058126 TaxID=3346350 RepID=UPI0036DD873B
MDLPEPSQRLDQSRDGLLVADDLPEEWHLHLHFPGDRGDDPSLEIDELLGYDRWMSAPNEQSRVSVSDQNETIDGRWRWIEHIPTHTRVMIRLQRQTFALPEEVRITGVIYLPWRGGQPITSQLLRELPTARIEAAINQRLFAMKRTETRSGGKIVLPSGHKISERDLLNPIGDPKKTPDFYELVALQHGQLSRKDDKNPSATMAEINGVALSTAQGWITKARERGLLPPGRRGRAG